MSEVFVLYHHNCTDGSGSKYAAWRHFGENACYIAVSRGEPFPGIPLTAETEIYILDFSYDRDVLEQIHKQVKKLVVIDHHDTSEDDLVGLPFANFNLEKSGAVLAWEYFHPNKPIPMFLLHVQDDDLWQQRHHDTPAVINGFKSHKNSYSDMLIWDKIVNEIDFFDQCKMIGHSLTQNNDSRIASFIDLSTKKVKLVRLFGKRVALYNTVEMVSDIGNALCRVPEFNLDYTMSFLFTSKGQVVLSFRTIPGKGIDVSRIAKEYGGGGRHYAAGVTLPMVNGLALISDLYSLPDLELD